MTEEQRYEALMHALPPKNVRTWKDYARYPWLATIGYVKRVESVFGMRFLFFLGVSQMLLKGTAMYMTTSIMLPLFKNVLGIDAVQLQFYMLIVFLPWAVKPILGLLSDLTLIGGYHKRYWLIQAVIVGTAGAGLAILAYAKQSAAGIALCFMGVQLQIAIFDLMSEATYSKLMRDHPYTGSDAVTLVQGYQHIGSIIAMLLVGIMADHNLYYPLLSIVLCACVLPLMPTLFGWLPEEKNPHGIPQGNQSRCGQAFQFVGREQMKRDKGMIAVIAFTGIAAPITTLVVQLGDPGVGLVLALVMTSFILLGAYIVFPRIIFRIALFQVASTLSRPALGSAMDYFYTATPTCLADGPHFTFSFYQTTAGLIGAFFSLSGAFIYQTCLSGLRFRSVLIFTQILSGAVGSSDLFIIMRANIRLGIPDRLAFVAGESVLEPMLNMLNYIPATALLSKAVPVGMESSAFAFQAGISNFASMISELSGAMIFDAAGIKTTVPCEFDNLWWLIIVCHVALPIVGGVAACFLIPNVKQNADLTDEKTTSTGSLSMSNNQPYLSMITDSETSEAE